MISCRAALAFAQPPHVYVAPYSPKTVWVALISSATVAVNHPLRKKTANVSKSMVPFIAHLLR
jgi:hypothetical protein